VVQREADVGDVAHARQLVLLRIAPARCEVSAGAERAARAGDHDDPHSLVHRGVAERREELVPHRAVDRVLALRPVERDREHTVCLVDLQRLHGERP
jgi:hypothetical protein